MAGLSKPPAVAGRAVAAPAAQLGWLPAPAAGRDSWGTLMAVPETCRPWVEASCAWEAASLRTRVRLPEAGCTWLEAAGEGACSMAVRSVISGVFNLQHARGLSDFLFDAGQEYDYFT